MSPIDSVNPVPPVGASQETASSAQSPEGTRRLKQQERPPGPESGGQPDKPAQPEFALNMMRDVALRYKIDKETGALSLLIIDRQSRQIIRTVPPEELSRLGVNYTFDDLA
ncbi:MAG: flagellar protein FlaG [Chloroflexota bacterium]